MPKLSALVLVARSFEQKEQTEQLTCEGLRVLDHLPETFQVASHPLYALVSNHYGGHLRA
jgi:hypothetical protein